MRELSSNTKGAIAEAAIRLAAIEQGIAVYTPASGHSRADLVFEVGDNLYRVQVKWGRPSPNRDVIVVNVGGSSLSASGYVCTTYSADEVDLLAIYCGELRRAFLVPISVFAGMHGIQLRLTPPRNNQRACINLADDFAFEGAIAQLGERLSGTQEVGGSIPPSSTSDPSLEPAVITVGSNPFRDRLGYWMDVVAGGQEVVVTQGLKEISPTEAAAMMGMSRAQVRKLLDDGALPFRMVGSHHRIRLDAVHRWLEVEDARQEAAMADLTALQNELGLTE